MSLQVNEHAINEIAALTGIEAAKLKAELVVDAPEPPKETKIKDLLTDVVIMKKADHATLLDNHGKAKFDEGKHRSIVDLTKLALGENAFEIPKDMTREQVWEKAQSVLKTTWEKEAGKAPDEKLAQWAKEKEALQKAIGEKEKEVEKVKSELTQTIGMTEKRSKISAAVNIIPFAADGEILKAQRQTLEQIVLSSYNHKVEDGKDVWYDSLGNKQVDNLQNPKSIEDIVREKAVIFPTTKADSGRSDGSSKPNNPNTGELDAELAKCTSLTDVAKILEARKISMLDEEGRAIVAKFTQGGYKAK